MTDSERVEGVERVYEITFTLCTTEDEANAAFERVSNVICGVEHGPDSDDECPLQWVGGMQPDPEATIPTSAIEGVIEELDNVDTDTRLSLEARIVARDAASRLRRLLPEEEG